MASVLHASEGKLTEVAQAKAAAAQAAAVAAAAADATAKAAAAQAAAVQVAAEDATAKAAAAQAAAVAAAAADATAKAAAKLDRASGDASVGWNDEGNLQVSGGKMVGSFDGEFMAAAWNDYKIDLGSGETADLPAEIAAQIGNHNSADGAHAAKFAAKQDAISDLATIRSGAAAGATALQSVPNLDASKITSGTFADARIASAATWNAKQAAITASNKLSASLVDGLATVATSGSYDDLDDKPTIPAAQVNADWNSSSGLSQILNKPTLSTVATSGSYTDLSNKPTIPAAQVQSNWNETDTTSKAYIQNKPTLATVATSGAYSDLSGKPTLATVATSGSYTDLSNKPTIPSAVTESTVSGWGFTKNAGTVTGVKVNGSTLSPTSGVVDIGTVLTDATAFDAAGSAAAAQSAAISTAAADATTKANAAQAAAIAAIPYPINTTSTIQDRAINVTSAASVTIPDTFTDLIIRATVASALSVTVPSAITSKYGDAFPSAAGEYLVCITKVSSTEAYVRTITLEAQS